MPITLTWRALARPALSVALITLAAGAAYAVGGKDDGQDWPCIQRKVAKLAATDLQWQGPPIEEAKGWRQDEAVAGIVKQLASRRVPLADAVKGLKAYAEKIPAAERSAKLTLVFAGMLETVNEVRTSVISGIERFNKRQKQRSTEIEAEGTKLAELQKAAETGEKAKADYTKALELYDWNARVFEERRQNLPLACEIPPAIDGRAFEIVREIQALMGPPPG